MSNNDFNPNNWVNMDSNPTKSANIMHESSVDTINDVNELVKEIVSRGIDLTVGYDNWLKVGFALASELGESGRELYHQLSAQNAEYNYSQCDKQYTHCVKGHGSGVTIATLFHLAKEAGVDLKKEVFPTPLSPDTPTGDLEEEEEKAITAGTFSDKCTKEDYPMIIRRIIEECTEQETADMMCIGAVVETSSVIPNVYGIYDRRKIHAPLYASIVAPPASDKGQLTAGINLVRPIHQMIRDANQREMENYKQELAQYNNDARKNDGSTPPKEPPYRSLFIPANSSSTATYQALNDNHGVGLIFETEGDNMAQALKTDYGDYSVGLRAAFHHEAISYNRRKDNEHVDIQCPKLAVMISGTPRQLQKLFPDAENGLFSRFIHYMANRRLTWRNVFASDESTIDDAIAELGKKYLRVYKYLEKRQGNPIKFVLKENQQEEFNKFFEYLQTEQAAQIGDDIVATVRRLGLITFRIAMVLSVLRFAEMEQIEVQDEITCDDRDFNTAMVWVNILLNHSAMVYENYLNHQNEQHNNKLEKLTEQQKRLYEALGDEFTTQDYVAEAKVQNIPKKSADKYVGYFINKYKIAVRVKNGLYQKTVDKEDGSK